MPVTKTPHNLEAEEAVLACCLIEGSSDVFNEISPRLQTEDFYLTRNQKIWQGMIALTDKGSVIDMVTICDQLSDEEHIYADIIAISDRV